MSDHEAEARKVAKEILRAMNDEACSLVLDAEIEAAMPILLAFVERVRAEDAQRIRAQVGRAVHAEAEVAGLRADLEESRRLHSEACQIANESSAARFHLSAQLSEAQQRVERLEKALLELERTELTWWQVKVIRAALSPRRCEDGSCK